jgi:phage gp29-like protein
MSSKKTLSENKNSNKKTLVTVGGNLPRPGQTGARTIVLTQTQRFNIDMASYMAAIRGAENVDYSRRVKLYDLYSEICMDTHLSSVIDKRKSAILFTPITFKRNGIPDDSINEQLQSPWFYRFLSDVWDAQIWGFSLFQFYTDGEWLNYNLIPRKHIDPVKRLIMHMQTDIHGENWDNFDDLLFVGNPDDLGMLAKAAPYVIYKRGTMADWAQFSEIFGMPIREYTYDGNDENARRQTLLDVVNDGGAAVVIHPEGSNLRLVESGNKTGSADLYDRFTDRCNAEISKLFLGNTLTTEASATGTQALGTIQKKGENLINLADRKYILNILNYDMRDIFVAFGINTVGGRFEFVEPEEISASDKIAIIEKLHNMGLPIAHDYLYEHFGIEKPDNYNELIDDRKQQQEQQQQEQQQEQQQQKQEQQQQPEKKQATNRLSRFFAEALGKEGNGKTVLKW